MRADEVAFGPATLAREGPLAIVTLAAPDRRNALDEAMVAGLAAALDAVVESGSATRCLMLTGAGTAFCAGGDLTMDASTPVSLATHHHPLLRRLRRLPFPFLTAVNGVAAGLGMSYALMGDMVVAARSARLVPAFVRVGLSPDGGLTWLLPRLIGWARAKELMLLGEGLDAATAADWGLVNRVYDDAAFAAEARALAHRLADGPTLALAATRRLFWDGLEAPHEAQLAREADAQAVLDGSADFAEAVSAFIAKRPALFRGR